MRVSYLRDIIADENALPADKLKAVNSLLASHPADSIKLLQQKASLLSSLLKFHEAVNVYNRISKYPDLTLKDKLHTLDLLSRAMANTGDYPLSIRKSLEILKTDKPDSLKIYDVEAYIGMAYCQLELMLIEKASRDLHFADSIFNLHKKKFNPADTYETELALIRCNASLCTSQGNYDEAIRLVKKARSIATDSLTILNLNGYIGDIYSCAKEYEIAETYYNKIFTSSLSSHSRAVSLNNCMSMFNEQGRYEDALRLYQENIGRCPSGMGDLLSINMLANRAVSYAGLQDYKNGYELLMQSKERGDSIRNSFMAVDIRSTHEIEAAIRARQEADVRRKTMTLLFLAASGLLVLAVAAIVLLSLRKRRQATDILKLKLSLADIDQKYDKAMRHREMVIDSKNRELTANTLQLAQAYEFVSELTDLIRKPGLSDKSCLNDVKLRLKEYDVQRDMWDVFKMHFENVHPDFFRKLSDRHPDLSVNELRMCAYILLNLSTKEIATLTNRSPRTIETVKYRLHKKLNLEQESTHSYLCTILETPELNV